MDAALTSVHQSGQRSGQSFWYREYFICKVIDNSAIAIPWSVTQRSPLRFRSGERRSVWLLCGFAQLFAHSDLNIKEELFPASLLFA